MWGWKLPLTGWVIENLHEYLKNPYYVVIEREQVEVASSFAHKLSFKENYLNQFWAVLTNSEFWNPAFIFRKLKDELYGRCEYKNTEKVTEAMQKYYQKLDSFTSDKKACHLKFEDLINRPEESVNKIIEFLKITPSETQRLNALKCVDPSLRHF